MMHPDHRRGATRSIRARDDTVVVLDRGSMSTRAHIGDSNPRRRNDTLLAVDDDRLAERFDASARLRPCTIARSIMRYRLDRPREVMDPSSRAATRGEIIIMF